MIKKIFLGMKKWLIAIMVVLFVVPVAFIVSACNGYECPEQCDPEATECACDNCGCPDGECECEEE